MANSETLADIVSEMRTFGVRCNHRPFSWQMVDGILKQLADRVEAAAQRERAADETDDDETIDIDGIMDDPHYLPGDVAIALGI